MCGFKDITYNQHQKNDDARDNFIPIFFNK
jgi:hypothetical protein